VDTIATATAPPRGGPTLRPADLAAALLLTAALGWAYAPNFVELAAIWNDDPSYTHGWLIAPIALGFLWQRWDRLDRERLAPSLWGWGLLLAVLGLRAYLYHANQVWIENATFPVAVAAVALALGGRHLLRWAAPSIAYLWFMMPLPPSINEPLAGKLQDLATLGSTSLLQAMGLPALAEGHVIYIGTHQLEVERACSGLSMLMTFAALIAATTILIERPIWEKLVLLVSVVPIALISNILRIVLTAWAYHKIGPEGVVLPHGLDPKGVWTVGKLSHDTAGWAMMPIALVLVWIELRLMAWLIVEEDDRAINPLLTPGGTPREA
jgi:exosortase